MKHQIHIGQTLFQTGNAEVKGCLVEKEGEELYVINNFDQMPSFFMSIVSDSDHWMYLSSNGSLTAGRANPEQAIFPYYTDDKIHDYVDITGAKTIAMLTDNDKTYLWEPFSVHTKGAYQLECNLYKNACGNKIIFEEINLDLKVAFRYSWMNSEQFGWVRKSEIENLSKKNLNIELLDGIQNILAFGVNRVMQGMLSTLIEAYKKSELLDESGIGIFRLSSIPVDRAEPSEALKATTVWSCGLSNSKYLLSSNQLKQFRKGENIKTETESKGIKGAYFVNPSFKLQAGANESWYIVAEVCQDASSIVRLIELQKQKESIPNLLEKDIRKGTHNLESIVAKADGLEFTADQLNVKRHFSNAMFNCMRGGVPFNDYTVSKTDFIRHINHFNKSVFETNTTWFNALSEEITYYELIEKSTQTTDADLVRLSLEYLPLMFSRRHGDPSRPWNLFDIKLKNEDGSPSLYYQGNWRDIFQNWEALAMSYPSFLPGMIAKFLNATTIDGYNAYKITRDGIEWELMDPDDPWSNIGYWGDHQIIYLEKLLELSERFFPGKIVDWLDQKIFAYANVPYKHKEYQQLVKTPQDTIDFDDAKHNQIEKLVNEIGADGKLIQLHNKVLKANLAEKLFVPLLSKLSNFIPGAGIWMNTQRPEWNDANNALVGNGTSMVTLYYIRRYIDFLQKTFAKTNSTEWSISKEVNTFIVDLKNAFESEVEVLETPINNIDRKRICDLLGIAGSRFRLTIYSELSGENATLQLSTIKQFLKIAKQFVDHSIQLNKRADGLFHAYNLVAFNGNEISLKQLPEMLEGQVAVLGSGALSAEEALELLNCLRVSNLYRSDQRSYTLYPDKQLPLFLEKNNLTKEEVMASDLLKKLLNDGNTSILKCDLKGTYHFDGSINNRNALSSKINDLEGDYDSNLIEKDKSYLLELYENKFNHQSFTGRSGSFYKYEGLGSIYWHMVSKLLLAVSENIAIADKTDEDKKIIEELKSHYNEIREGIGCHKSPAEYGAFPTDPYSHTPSMSGVQQPGMTGQVKEDLLSRMFELGIEVENGKIRFEAERVKSEELAFVFKKKLTDSFADIFKIEYPLNSKFIAFSFCNVPVIYQESSLNKIVLTLNDGKEIDVESNQLNEELSSSIFNRMRSIVKIDVFFRTIK